MCARRYKPEEIISKLHDARGGRFHARLAASFQAMISDY